VGGQGWTQLAAVWLYGGALVFAAYSWRLAWDARLIVPFWDEWDFLLAFRAAAMNGIDVADLWAPYNGHRVFIPRVLYLLRDSALNGHPLPLVLACQILQGGLIGIIVATAWREPLVSRSLLRPTLIAVTIVLLTWTVQLENFHWSIQIVLVLPVFLCVASLALVSWYPPAGNVDWPMVVATLAGLVACLCHGAGLGIWPALSVVAISQRRDRHWMLPVAAGACLALAMYLGLILGNGAGAALAHPLGIVLFVSRLAGPPFALDIQQVPIGAVLVLGGITAIGVAIWHGIPARLGSLSIGLVTFALSVMLSIAVERSELGGPGASRYVAFSSLYWVGLTCLIGLLTTSGRWRTIRFALYAVLGYGILGFPVMASERVAADLFLDRADRSTAAVLSIVAGVPDDEAIAANLYPRPHVPRQLVPFLARRGYGFFGERLVRTVGHSVSDDFVVGVDQCRASVTLDPLHVPGLRLAGRYEAGDGPSWLVIVGLDDRIRGLAVRRRLGAEFTGYAPHTVAGGTLFGVTGNVLCRAGVLPPPRGNRDPIAQE